MTAAATPTDSPIKHVPDKEPRPDKGKKNPNRGKRKRVFSDGEGDYCILEIAGEGSDAPRGSLIPVPGVPRFPSIVHAQKWLRESSGDTLTGKQIAVVRFMRIMSLQVEMRPVVRIVEKPRVEAKPVLDASPAEAASS